MKSASRTHVSRLAPIALLILGCPKEEGAQDVVTAFTNVSVIAMAGGAELVAAHQDVVVRNDAIESITETGTSLLPPSATVVDGTGRYLLPGLIDMHVHFLDQNELTMFVANGVTTVRNLGDFPDPDHHPESWAAHTYYESTVEVREQVLSGEWLGPDMVLAGHILDGPEPTLPQGSFPIASIDEIPDVIAAEAAAGYDMIKVYDLVPADYFDVILEQAAQHEMPVVGHAPLALSFAEILASGLHSNEHLTMFRNYSEIEPILGEVGPMVAESGIWNCPTLVAMSHAHPPGSDPFDAFFADPSWAYLSPETKKLVEDVLGGNHYEVYMGEFLDVYFLPLTSLLHQSGARLLLGTDAPFALPGFAVHEELAYLVSAGLTPYEALRTGTYNAAESLDRLDELGTVEAGKRADLVLLDENPLEDIAHTSEIAGVMLRGRWLPEHELDARLDALSP